MNQPRTTPNENLPALTTVLQGKYQELGLAMLAFKGDRDLSSEISEISQMSDVEFEEYNTDRLSLVKKIDELEAGIIKVRAVIRAAARADCRQTL